MATIHLEWVACLCVYVSVLNLALIQPTVAETLQATKVSFMVILEKKDAKVRRVEPVQIIIRIIKK